MEALYGALRHSLRAPPHRSVPPLNLHRARVRRNRGRLPSSRCIESAQTHRARACALPARASDTTLGLLAQDSFRLPVNRECFPRGTNGFLTTYIAVRRKAMKRKGVEMPRLVILFLF